MEEQLKDLQRRIREAGHTLDQADLTLLSTALLSAELRPLVYITLGLVFNASTNNPPLEGSQTALSQYIPERVSNWDEIEKFPGAVRLLAAIFQIDNRLASEIFTKDGFLESLVEAAELHSHDLEVLRAVTQVLSAACGVSATRDLVASSSLTWLETISRIKTTDTEVRAAALCALLKLSGIPPSTAGAPTSAPSGNEDLVVATKDLFLSMETSVIASSDALEGLAYASTRPAVKQLLSEDSKFLSELFTLIPERASGQQKTPSSIYYGFIIVTANLVRLRPQLSEEELKMQQLRRMASKGASSANTETADEKLDDNNHVRERIERVIKAGCLSALSRLSKMSCTDAVARTIGVAYLSIIEFNELRGHVLQSGGSKALLRLLYTRPLAGNDDFHLVLTQALAKLAITASPMQVFGPDGNLASEAIKPFTHSVMHPNSTLLQRFESLMALTNLASMGEDMARRISRTAGFLEELDSLLLNNHTLVRRASVELLCNLVGSSSAAFDRVSGLSGQSPAVARSKLQILVALSDVDDVPTRLAASAVLAMISGSQNVVVDLVVLQAEKRHVIPILSSLLETPSAQSEASLVTGQQPSSGLYLRGITCFDNILTQISSVSKGDQFVKDANELGLGDIVERGCVALVNEQPEVRALALSVQKSLQR